jgi:hypothetical protein
MTARTQGDSSPKKRKKKPPAEESELPMLVKASDRVTTSTKR